eukprot:m51a1_g7580 hypothetical protein (303) ;mRNA; f:188890-190361
MRVFVTGATGYIGGEVVRELLARGHAVTALVRGDASRAPRGSTGLVGTLDGLAGWLPAAVQHDAIVHCAYDMAAVAQQGSDAVGRREGDMVVALAEAAKKEGRTKVIVITTSLSAVVGQPGTPDEYSPTDRIPEWTRSRFDSEARFLATSSPSMRACCVRPAWVYGGRGGVLAFVRGAPQGGAPFVVGDGAAAVSLVSVRDLARLYAFVVEDSRCVGVFHGVSEGNYSTWREVAERVSHAKGARGDVDRIPLEEARKKMSYLADLLATPLRIGGRRAHEMGFEFTEPRLMDAFDRFWEELSY